MVGVLSDDTDPMVTVMKLEKAPQETYADIGGKEAEQLLNITLKTMYVYNICKLL